ncbi:MAG: putative DNA binding domain-containing protein [Bacteroidota bacterium]|nr:putative DNA binding domain-containing protein [Bacteroidota bacterium]
MKNWIDKAVRYLNKSMGKVPQELNEIDWKETISPNNKKIQQHICAFANMPGGGFLVFGINNKNAVAVGVNQKDANAIVEKLASISRDGVEPLVSIDHSIESYNNVELLFIHINESAEKPVHISGKSIEESFIRSGGTTRKASRQEIGALMLNSKNPTFEELHASKLINEVEVITLLAYDVILKLLKKPVPNDVNEIIKWLEDEKMIKNIDGKGFYITNFGALSAAKDLNRFDGVSRKSVRIIKYEGKLKLVEVKSILILKDTQWVLKN